ncbi:flagellar hook-associated protein FlgL [Evansella sp. AB-rgal1]|uniref:flagellar hook-associated protein FlgL n=1 Tax=Evansella sp. AB-rgal1 TaxID=3242696 RepID=UPI00359D7119
MRVTQMMLSNNSLRHLSGSYQTLQTLQDQLSTGKKISRASQDPVVAMNGMRYRTQVTEIEQFKRNLGEVYNWMENGDAALNEATNALHRIRELTVQASNDTYESAQRSNIAKEVAQLRDHLMSLANTKANNKYLFNGTNTTNPPVQENLLDVGFAGIADALDALPNNEFEPGEFSHVLNHMGDRYELREKDDNTYLFVNVNNPGKTIMLSKNEENGSLQSVNYSHTYEKDGVQVTDEKVLQEREFVISSRQAVSTNSQVVEMELLKGVNIPVNIDPNNIFSSEFFADLIQLEKAMKDSNVTGEKMTEFLAVLDRNIDKVVNERAELGARYNRVEMIEYRVMEQEVIAKRTLSHNEDADIEKVISSLLMAENVHRAALSSMSRIMQPSLMDFLR